MAFLVDKMEGTVDMSEEQSNNCSLMIDETDNHEKEQITMEDILHELGILGKYQMTQIISSCPCILTFVFIVLNYVFIGYEPSHTCDFVNETSLLDRYELMNDSTARISYGSCSIVVSTNRTGQETDIASLECYNGYSYAGPGGKQTSMVTEWDLVCDKLGVAELVQTLFTLGMAIGGVFVTSFGDRYGRKYTYMFALTGLFATELGLAFTPSLYVAYGIRLLSGLLAGGIISLHFVPCMELIISKHRQIFGALDCLLWVFDLFIFTASAYFLRVYDWRYLQLMTAGTCVPAIIGAFFLNETPEWYFAKSRYEDARHIIIKACKMNGKNVDTVLGTFRSLVRRAQVKNSPNVLQQSNATYSLFDILRTKYLFLILAVSCMSWFINSLSYYGLFLTSSGLAGDRFLNFFLMAAVEIPSTLANMILLIYFGRRTVVIVFMAMSGVCLLISTVLVGLNSESEDALNASKVFLLLGKFAITSCFNVVFTYTPELFPTTIRATGLALCATAARVGGMLAPFLLPLYKIVSWAPGTILTCFCFSCVCLIPLLPETRGRELPTTIEDILAWDKSKKHDRNNSSSLSVDLKSRPV